MTESNIISLKFILINFIFNSLFILFMPIIEIIFVLVLNPSWNRPSDYNYLSKPLLFVIPLLYLIISIMYILVKKFHKSIFMFTLFIYVTFGFFMWNHNQETFDSFRTVFSNLGIMKK